MDKSGVIKSIIDYKNDPQENTVTVRRGGRLFHLVPLGPWAGQRTDLMELMTLWRGNNQSAFPACFRVTVEGTAKWFRKRVVDDSERLLFGIFDSGRNMVGHCGFGTFDWNNSDCEIDNVMRGSRDAPKGLMTDIVDHFVNHAYETWNMRSVSLRVFGDNVRAIKLYLRCGFRPIESIPMECVFNDEGFAWRPQASFVTGRTTRIFLRMKHERYAGAKDKAAA